MVPDGTSAESGTAQRPGSALARPVLALALGLAEYLAISLLFDARTLLERAEGSSFLAYLGDAATLGLVIATVTLSFSAPSLQQALRNAPVEPVRMPWVAAGVHVVAYVAFLALTARVFDPNASSDALLAAAWIGCGAVVAASLIYVALPRPALRAVAPRLSAALGIGVLVGGITWSASLLSQQAWGALEPAAVRMAAGLLRLVEDDVVVDVPSALLGTSRFQVVVSRVCSGIEGVTLLFAFLAAAIVFDRRSLRIARALWLLPLAMAISYLANILRIALLVLVGAHVAPQVALGGFHSKAGWLFFCGLAIAFLAVLRTSPYFRRDAPGSEREPVLQSRAAPYLLPLLVVMASAIVTGLFSSGVDLAYGVRVLAGALVLFAYRRRYAWSWAPSAWPIAIGVAVFGMWLALAQGGDGEHLRAALAELPPAAAIGWLAVRAIGTIVVVPVVEELAFRGYLLRLVMDSTDFTRADVTRVHPLAFAVSSVAFGLLHGDWLAGILAGLAFAWAQQRRGRLEDAIVAHALTNALLVADALLRGQLGWLG
jgi:exosortase E/protease (VPEID-CTERM system)